MDSIHESYIPWRDEILAKNYECIIPRLFINPKIMHLTLMMLPLSEAGMVERAKGALMDIEPKIK